MTQDVEKVGSVQLGGSMETEIAERMVAWYGVTRAFWVADVYERTARGALKALYWRVKRVILLMEDRFSKERKSTRPFNRSPFRRAPVTRRVVTPSAEEVV